MEKIEPGKFVAIVYDLYKINKDGSEELVHQVDKSQPETFIFGLTRGLVEPLEKDIEGKEAGYKFNITSTADKAYGERSDEYIAELEKDVFNIDGKFDSEVVKVGASLPMMTAEGMPIYGTVLEVGDKTVKMDFNHPLAGYAVRFDGEIVEVRDANPEEIKMVQGGCGCGCSSCGDDCDCSAEGNCNDNACSCK